MLKCSFHVQITKWLLKWFYNSFWLVILKLNRFPLATFLTFTLLFMYVALKLKHILISLKISYRANSAISFFERVRIVMAWLLLLSYLFSVFYAVSHVRWSFMYIFVHSASFYLLLLLVYMFIWVLFWI